jgi:hypothetical protein
VPVVVLVVVYLAVARSRRTVAGTEVAGPADALADAFAEPVVHPGDKTPLVVLVACGDLSGRIGDRYDVAVSVIHVPERFALERDGQRTAQLVVGVFLEHRAGLVGLPFNLPRVALVVVVDLPLHFLLLVEVNDLRAPVPCVVGVGLALSVWERQLRELSFRVPFIGASPVARQVAAFIMEERFFSITDFVNSIRDLVAFVVSPCRADDRVAGPDFSHDLEQVLVFTRRQVNFAVHDVVDDAEQVLFQTGQSLRVGSVVAVFFPEAFLLAFAVRERVLAPFDFRLPAAFLYLTVFTVAFIVIFPVAVFLASRLFIQITFFEKRFSRMHYIDDTSGNTVIELLKGKTVRVP